MHSTHDFRVKTTGRRHLWRNADRQVPVALYQKFKMVFLPHAGAIRFVRRGALASKSKAHVVVSVSLLLNIHLITYLHNVRYFRCSIILIYRDRLRTSLNVFGNCVGAAIVYQKNRHLLDEDVRGTELKDPTRGAKSPKYSEEAARLMEESV